MEAAPKLFEMLGGPITERLAVPVLPVPPLVEVTCTELVNAPAVVPVTFTDKVQVPAAAIDPPAKLTEDDPAVAVLTPLQVLASPLRLETCIPAGNESVKATPVSVVAEFGLVMVKLRLVLPFRGMETAPKLFAMLGGAITERLAVPVLPVPPLVEVTCTELVNAPAVVPVTFTDKVQVPAAEIDPPARLTEDDPAVAVLTPLQVLASPLGLETCIPAGNESVKATPVSVVAEFGLVMVKLRLVLPFSGMETAPKLFEMLGGPITERLADPVLPVPPLVEVTCTELVNAPAVVPVTFTDKVQVPAAEIDPPATLTEDEPAVAVATPPHVLASPLGPETCIPAGNESVKATPVRVVAEFGLVMVKLRLVLPFSGMETAPKLFAMLGGPITERLAVPVLPVPPLVEVTCTELVHAPAVVPVTVTDKVHDPAAAIDPPAKLTEDDPAVAVPTPLQVFASPLGLETCIPAGNESVKATPVRVVVEFGLEMLSVKVVVPPAAIEGDPKDLLMEGGATTVRVAVLDVLPGPLSLALTTLVVLFCTPAVIPTIVAVRVQVMPAPREMPWTTNSEEVVPVVLKPGQLKFSMAPLRVGTLNPVGYVSV
jgi:hypothetical protein